MKIEKETKFFFSFFFFFFSFTMEMAMRKKIPNGTCWKFFFFVAVSSIYFLSSLFYNPAISQWCCCWRGIFIARLFSFFLSLHRRFTNHHSRFYLNSSRSIVKEENPKKKGKEKTNEEIEREYKNRRMQQLYYIIRR